MSGGSCWLGIDVWVSLGLIVFAHAGYPLLMECMAVLFKGRRWRKASPPVLPEVSVVLVARNEAKRISARLEDLRAQDYPPELVEVILVSDGSTDETVLLARESADLMRLRVIEVTEGRGKSAGLNEGIAQAAGEIVVLTDVRQRFGPGAIRHLVNNFSDASVGAVSGRLEIAPSVAGSPGTGVGLYWKLERRLRLAEARFDSCVGCTGAIYAIRRALFEPIPSDTLLDDLVIPMGVVDRGHRVVYDLEALAFDPQPSDPKTERPRKRRTLAGNFQCLLRHPAWFLPGGSRLWAQAFSHKLLRLAVPLLLIHVFLRSCLLAGRFPFDLLAVGQIVFYGLAALGLSGGKTKGPLVTVPAGFVFLNWMVCEGLWYYLRGGWRTGWKSGQPHAGSRGSGESGVGEP